MTRLRCLRICHVCHQRSRSFWSANASCQLQSYQQSNCHEHTEKEQKKNQQVGVYQFFQLDRHWKGLTVAHQDITTLHPHEATRAYVAAAGTAAISGLARPQAGKLKLQQMR